MVREVVPAFNRPAPMAFAVCTRSVRSLFAEVLVREPDCLYTRLRRTRGRNGLTRQDLQQRFYAVFQVYSEGGKLCIAQPEELGRWKAQQ